MESHLIPAYRDLLQIRLKAARRNVIMVGAVFGAGLAAFFSLGLLDRLANFRESTLSGLLLVLLGLGFVSALVRFEVARNNRDLIRALFPDS